MDSFKKLLYALPDEELVFNVMGFDEPDILREQILDNPNKKFDFPVSKDTSMLHAACFCRRPRLVEVLLHHPELNPNIECFDGSTALMEACIIGEMEVIKMLANDNRVSLSKVDKDGRTALWWVAKRGNIEAVKSLLASGKELNLGQISVSGTNCQQVALLNDHTEVVQLLQTFHENPEDTKSKLCS